MKEMITEFMQSDFTGNLVLVKPGDYPIGPSFISFKGESGLLLLCLVVAVLAWGGYDQP